MKMTTILPAGQNHKVFADNYFTSVPLVEKNQNTHNCSQPWLNFTTSSWEVLTSLICCQHFTSIATAPEDGICITVIMAVINAWILYKKDQQKLEPKKKPMALRRFPAFVGTSLTSAGKGKIRCGRPLSSLEPGRTPRKRQTTAVPHDVRKDGVDHLPIIKTEMQLLLYSTGSHFSHVYCGKFQVHLCLNRNRNCFLSFHAN